MKDKEKIKTFLWGILVVVITTLVLSIMNSAFIPSFMLMLSLFIFGICFYIYDNDKKIVMYILFIIGVLLIVGSLVYTYMRLV